VKEKWEIASDSSGSGNTANIGSIVRISDILAGNGIFKNLGEEWFDDYWMNYNKITIKTGKTKKTIRKLSDFLKYRLFNQSSVHKRRTVAKVFVPPIKSQGIKTKIVPWILSNVERDNHGRWIEPFMGTGVVGFNVRPAKAIFSDINPHLINFYSALKSGAITPAKVKQFLEEEGGNLQRHGESYFYKIRERFNKDGNPLDFLFLSRSCFNGMIRFNSKGGFNVPFCRKLKRFAQAYITKIVNQTHYVCQAIAAHQWEFVCQDFRTLIKTATKHDFIYCDPPYFGRHVDYFNSWNETDENDLYSVLHSTKAKFILSTWYKNSYRENLSIQKYWKDFMIQTKNHFYHVGGKEINRNPMVEAIVTNYTRSNIHKELIPANEPEQLILMERQQSYKPKLSKRTKR
jgi:DNA adenine methylase